ncbi:hypothetical protein Tco_0967865 [Tanacetum coccineum]
MLEKGSYVLWANRFIRYIDGKKGQGIRIKHSTEYGPFKLGMVPTSNSTTHAPGKSLGYTGGNRRNAGNQGRYDVNQGSAAGNDIVQPTIAKTDTMRLAAKYEAGVHLDDEENDFMLTSAIGDDHLEEINASVIMMDRLQPIDNDSDAEPK